MKIEKIALIICFGFLCLTAFVFSQGRPVTASRIIYSDGLPAVCSPASGDMWFVRNTTTPKGLYFCATLNTFRAVGVTFYSANIGALDLSPIAINQATLAAIAAGTNNGTIIYCSDCTIASPCAGGGSGAIAKRLNGVWVCN